MFSNFLPIAAFFAGLVSVLSPCILPVIPAVFAYSTEKGKFRPLAIVLGLSISFTSMGIVTSIFGAKLTPYLGYLNIFAEILLITMGIALLFDLNIFNVFGNFSSLANPKREELSEGYCLAFLLELSGFHVLVGLVAISPQWLLFQVRLPMEHQLLFVYFIGFSIPMLFVAYSGKLLLLKNKGGFKTGSQLKTIAGLVILGVGFIWFRRTTSVVSERNLLALPPQASGSLMN